MIIMHVQGNLQELRWLLLIQIWQCYMLSTMPHNFIEIELRHDPFLLLLSLWDNINNMAFFLDCGTLWLEMANGAFHTALSTKLLVVVSTFQRVSTLTLIFNFKVIGFRWPPKHHAKVMKVSWKFPFSLYHFPGWIDTRWGKWMEILLHTHKES